MSLSTPAHRPLLSLLLLLLTLLSPSSSKLLSSRQETQINGWSRISSVPPTSPHSFTLALHQRNTDRLSSILDSVSNPTSPDYGHYLTQAQLTDLTALPASATDPLIHWLTAGGVPRSSVSYTPGVGAMRVEAEVGVVNELFGTEMWRWRHEDGREAVVSWGEASMPDEFAQVVDAVVGLTDFPPPLHHSGPVRSRPHIHPAGVAATQLS